MMRRAEEEGPSSLTQDVTASQIMEVEKRLSYGLSHHLVNTLIYVCKARGGGTEVVGAGEGKVGSGEEGSWIFSKLILIQLRWSGSRQDLASRRP